MERYVIYLSSCSLETMKTARSNAYGYWIGKDYIHDKTLFPVCNPYSKDNAKVYTSKKRAENALKKALMRPYAYVCDGRIEEL